MNAATAQRIKNAGKLIKEGKHKEGKAMLKGVGKQLLEGHNDRPASQQPKKPAVATSTTGVAAVTNCSACGKDHTREPAGTECMRAIREARLGKSPIPTNHKAPEGPAAAKKKAEDIDYSADANKSAGSDIRQITLVAEKLLAKIKEFEDKKEMMNKLMEEITLLEQGTLPDMMAASGVETFTLKTGEVITIKPVITASIPTVGGIAKEKDQEKREQMEERRVKAFTFLRKNGAGALIKRTVYVELGKDSDKSAKEAMKALKSLGLKPEQEEGVHAQTLSSWVRERLADGKPVDQDALAVHDFKRAVITAKK